MLLKVSVAHFHPGYVFEIPPITCAFPFENNLGTTGAMSQIVGTRSEFKDGAIVRIRCHQFLTYREVCTDHVYMCRSPCRPTHPSVLYDLRSGFSAFLLFIFGILGDHQPRPAAEHRSWAERNRQVVHRVRHCHWVGRQDQSAGAVGPLGRVRDAGM